MYEYECYCWFFEFRDSLWLENQANLNELNILLEWYVRRVVGLKNF